jgi:hypothetical protein
MSDFYHRYQSLFELPDSHPNTSFVHKKKLDFGGSFRVNQNLSTFNPQFNHQKDHNFSNLSRSPALDEFQQSVLPKLNKNYPISSFNRLKTDIEESNTKLAHELSNNSNSDFYQLPKIYAPKAYQKR